MEQILTKGQTDCPKAASLNLVPAMNHLRPAPQTRQGRRYRNWLISGRLEYFQCLYNAISRSVFW